MVPSHVSGRTGEAQFPLLANRRRRHVASWNSSNSKVGESSNPPVKAASHCYLRQTTATSCGRLGHVRSESDQTVPGHEGRRLVRSRYPLFEEAYVQLELSPW